MCICFLNPDPYPAPTATTTLTPALTHRRVPSAAAPAAEEAAPPAAEEAAALPEQVHLAIMAVPELMQELRAVMKSASDSEKCSFIKG